MADPPTNSAYSTSLAPKDPSPRYSYPQSNHSSSYSYLQEENERGAHPSDLSSSDEELPSLKEKSPTGSQETLPDNLESLLSRPDKSFTKKKPQPLTPSAYDNNSNITMPTSSSSEPSNHSSSLTRRAHRFSSLKKKKGAGVLLNRIFCNSPTASKPSERLTPSDSNEETYDESIVDTYDGTIIQDHFSNSASSEENQLPSPKPTSSSSCDLQSALDDASEKLTLHSEDKVRHTIQTSLRDVLVDACAAPQNSSPPTLQNVCFDVPEACSPKKEPVSNRAEQTGTDVEDDDVQVPKRKHGESLVAALRRGFSSPQKTPPKKAKPMKTPGGLVIPSPFTHSTSKSLYPTTLDRLFCRPNVEKKTPERIQKQQSGAFPKLEHQSSGPDRISSLLSESVDSNADEEDDFDDDVRQQRSNRSHDDILEPIALVRMVQSQEDLSTVEEVSSSKEAMSTSGGAEVDQGQELLLQKQNSQVAQEEEDDEEAFLPDDFKAHLGSSSSSRVEELSTHDIKSRSGSSSKVEELYTHDQVQEKIRHALADHYTKEQVEEQVRHAVAEERFTKNDVEQRIQLAVAANMQVETALRQKLEEEQKAKLEAAIDDYKAQGEKLLQEHNLQRKKEHEIELKKLRASYERRIAEQKDQIAIANRLARSRQMELEQLEASNRSKNKSSDTDGTLRKELEQACRDKQIEVDRLTKELETFKAQASEQNELSADKDELLGLSSNLLDRVRKELADVKSQLAVKEREAKKLATQAEELKQIKKELDSSKSAEANHATAAAKWDANVKKLESELNSVKEALASKEKELEAANMRATTSSEPRTPSRLGTPNRVGRSGTPNRVGTPDRSGTPNRVGTPGRSGTPANTPTRLIKPTTPNVRSGGAKTSFSGSKNELHEREKESLRKQISMLEEQASKVRQEHENALDELRRASEAEIVHVKKEVEGRLEKHMERERELKETLSNVSSREKEELLEEIERLQAEKKAERNGGLREVQRKEDLLQRIATLEGKERKLIEDHERVMQDLRVTSDAEIKVLREEMEQQEKKQRAKENELRRAISETNSFDKEELLHSIEKLEGQLDSERSASVLIKLKLSTVEKEAAASLKSHEEAMDKLKVSSSETIKELRQQLEEKCEVEEAMKAKLGEHEVLKKRLEELKTALEETKLKSTKQLDELRMQHVANIATLTMESQAKVESAHAESRDAIKTAQEQFDKSFAELKNEYDSKISLLQKELEEKEAKFKAEYEVLSKRSTNEAKELRDEITTLKQTYETSKQAYEERILEVEKDHGNELDELLAQLDLVEAEHKETIESLKEKMVGKEAMVTELRAQLEEAQTKTKSSQHGQEKALVDIKQARKEVADVQQALDACQKEMKALKESHRKQLLEMEELRKKACEDAREEMIERAEAQFKQANELYIKLKRQYDAVKKKADNVEIELKNAKETSERTNSEKEVRIVDLNAEVAQLKVKIATVEADSAQKAKEYRREMEGLLQAAKDFETKCSESDEATLAAQTALAKAVAEKERIQMEYTELNKVCEELMAHVESQGHHEC